MPSIFVVLLLVPGAVAAPPRVVDSSLHEGAFHDHNVAFGSDGTGWLANGLGEVYCSFNDGATWRQVDALADPIVTFRFTSTLAVALTAAGKLFSSIDNGRHWRYRDTATGHASPGGVEVIASHIWISGSDAVSRSDDGGLSFHRLPVTRYCAQLSFGDALHGWLECGSSLLETVDGGDHFNPLSSPKVYLMRRPSPALGWLLGENHLYRTVDGGQHWQNLGSYKESYFHINTFEDALGRIHARFNDVPAIADSIPVFHDFVRYPHSDLIGLATNGSAFPTGTMFRRLYPIIRMGPPAPEPLLAEIKIAERRWYGASLGRIYHSDDGTVWYVVADAPAAIARIAFLDERAMIMESTDGRWFRADRGGRNWKLSQDVGWDRFELERALGLEAKSPLSCLTTAHHASIDVDFGFGGCNITRHHALHLSIDLDGQSRLTGQFDDQKRRVYRILNAVAVRLTITSLVAAIERPDVRAQAIDDNPELRNDCMSSSCNRASFRWSCDWASGVIDLPRSDFDLSVSPFQCATSYSRTNGLNEAAAAALKAP